MRILQLCPYFYPVLGGMERVVFNLSRAMVDRGHEVTVFSSDLDRTGRVLAAQREEVEGIEVVRFRAWLKLGSFASFWPGFMSELRFRSFDIIHAHAYRHPHCHLASLRALRKSAKFVLQPHWPGHPRSRFQAIPVSIYDSLVGNHLLRSCDLVLALTPLEVPWLRARGARNVKVLPNAVPRSYLGPRDGQAFRQKYGIDGFLAVSVGRVERMKGFHLAIEAMHEVPDMHYAIVGAAGDSYSQLCGLIESRGLVNRVTLTGALSENDTLDAISASDVYVQPSFFEASPVSTLEAMATGRLCVAAAVGGLPWLLEGCGLLFRPGDVGGLAACLQRARYDEHVRKQLGEAAWHKASGLTWDQIGDTYQNYLSELGAA